MFCSKATKEDFLKIRTRYDNEDFMERISCDITRSEFDVLYSIPQKPVMLVGCDDSWPAKYKWSMDQLAKRFDRDTLWRAVVGEEDDMDNEKNKQTPWGKIADAIANNVTFNLFDNIDDPHQQELISDYEWPLFARNTDVHDHFENIPPQDYGSMRWFGAASPLTGTDIHYDPYDTDAWNTVVQGEKWWFLMPFEADSHFVLHCSPSCSTPNPSMLDKYIGVLTSESHEVQKFNEKYLSFSFQKAGETLYLPTRFLHRYVYVAHMVKDL
jgi:histone arginine demethylase JMJD6